MGLFGFLDDYLKVIKKYPDGLIARYKMAGQVSLGLIVGFSNYLSCSFRIKNSNFNTIIANGSFDIGLLYILVILVITGTSNAVNLTDGLDGLATGLWLLQP